MDTQFGTRVVVIMFIISFGISDVNPMPDQNESEELVRVDGVALFGGNSDEAFSFDQMQNPRPAFVPQCAFTEYLYDSRAKKCSYSSFTRQHCGEDMFFLPVNGTPGLGACTCTIRSTTTCDRPRILWPKHERCYELATQGPCGEKEWLAPVNETSAQCDKNACLHMSPINAEKLSKALLLNDSQHPVYNFTYQGNCYITETQAFCKDGQVARFYSPFKIPRCVPWDQIGCRYQPLGISTQQPVPCPEGYTADSTNVCVKIANFGD